MEKVSLPASCNYVVTSNLNGYPNLMCSAFVVLTSSSSSDSEAALESVTSLGQKETSCFL